MHCRACIEGPFFPAPPSYFAVIDADRQHDEQVLPRPGWQAFAAKRPGAATRYVAGVFGASSRKARRHSGGDAVDPPVGVPPLFRSMSVYFHDARSL